MKQVKDSKIIDMPIENESDTVAFNRANYGDVIRKNRVRAGLTQPQLAELLQTNKNYVSNWEVGRTRPDMAMIPKLCKVIGISIAEFFGEFGDLTRTQQARIHDYLRLGERDRRVVDALIESLVQLEHSDERQRVRDGFIRIFHNTNVAAAGLLNDMDDGLSGEGIFLRRDAATERADEVITVSGDSMEPTFYDGDDLLVEHTEQIGYGEIGIFVINGEGFVKEYRRGGVYSHNDKKYPFRKFLPDDDVRCIGRVLGKVESVQRPSREEVKLLSEL